MTTWHPWPLLILAALALWAPGCVGWRDTMIATLNATSLAADAFGERLEARYRAEQDAIIESDAPTASKQLALTELARVYRPAFRAHEAFRVAWLSAAAAVDGDETRALEALAAAQQAFWELDQAWAVLGGEVE